MGMGMYPLIRWTDDHYPIGKELHLQLHARGLQDCCFLPGGNARWPL